MTNSWPLSRQQMLDDSGRPLLIPRANFYQAGTTKPLTVYRDAARTVPWTQPVEADGFGRFPRVYLPDGLYREEVTGPYGEPLWNDDGLGEPVVEAGPDLPDDPTARATTGDIKWRLDASIQAGWVRMNARTLGSAASGATELANISARPLFLYLWTTFPDSVASVIGGRGVSASEDFSSGRQIIIPSMQGLVAGGLDDMGSAPTNRLQTSAQLTLTAGSTVATVDNPRRIALGMVIVAGGVAAGATVVGRSGNTITMSAPAGAGTTGTVPARFSFFADAQMPGQAAGDSVADLTVDQLPVFTPSGTIDPAGEHTHVLRYRRLSNYATNAGSGGVDTISNSDVSNTDSETASAGAHAHTYRGDPVGGNQSHSNLQPTRLGTYYLKL